jgi:hypothetical protein
MEHGTRREEGGGAIADSSVIFKSAIRGLSTQKKSMGR